ncbi:hypothetical protein JHK82_031131 [Glycine max]|nr:hypothetical protein JHK85_031779 [Glycine max]KAG5124394.1 hypothetical protein JHK82_031131 [Glycine max]
MVLPHFKHSRFKDDQHCSHRIAEVLDLDGKISPAQISNMLKRLGLVVAPRRKMCDADAKGPLSTSPNLLDGDKITGATNHKSVNLEGSLLVQHLQNKKRVQAFNKDQEALIKVLYEQFKDYRRCSYMIANALDKDGKFTTAQVSRKLKQLGLSLPLKSSGGKMHPKGADLMDRSNERMDESDDETLVSLVKRKKMESGKLSRGQLHGQTSQDKLSKGDSDDEMLSFVLKKMLKKMKKQPLLFVELLFWKTRRECHYVNAEYLLSELEEIGSSPENLKKESANWNKTQGDEEIGSSPAKVWTQDIKSLLIKLCKNSKKFKWWGGSRFRVRVDAVIPYLYPTFGYREKPEPEPIPSQFEYYSSKSGRIRTGTHGYEFSCHT